MKLIGAIYDPLSIDAISSYVDGVVVYSSDFSSFYMRGYNIDEILSLEEKYKGQIFINIEFMLEDKEVENIKDFIIKTHKENVYYIFSDLGILQILKELNIKDKGIYNPNTMITNSYDANFYLNQGSHAVNLSLEITLDQQEKIIKNKLGSIWMELFGYHLMFHSKRYLISLYEEFLGKKIDKDNYNSFLIEQTRKDKYHIYESNRGTSLFRPYVLSYFENLDNLKNLDYGFISNMFIDYSIYLKVLEVFSNYLKGNISKEEGLSILNTLNLNYEDGFKYQDTIYQKELRVNE